MASTRTVSAQSLPNNTTKELDIYAAEFAKLVDRHNPTRRDTPSEWLRRLPDEAFQYYQKGIASFGSSAQTPIERRGRLYLMHTALLFMWMCWGKSDARSRFRSEVEMGTQRAASLITLELYRRAGILDDYESPHWFYQPVGKWTVRIKCHVIDQEVLSDPQIKDNISENEELEIPVRIFSILRTQGAVPNPETLL